MMYSEILHSTFSHSIYGVQWTQYRVVYLTIRDPSLSPLLLTSSIFDFLRSIGSFATQHNDDSNGNIRKPCQLEEEEGEEVGVEGGEAEKTEEAEEEEEVGEEEATRTHPAIRRRRSTTTTRNG